MAPKGDAGNCQGGFAPEVRGEGGLWRDGIPVAAPGDRGQEFGGVPSPAPCPAVPQQRSLSYWSSSTGFTGAE